MTALPAESFDGSPEYPYARPALALVEIPDVDLDEDDLDDDLDDELDDDFAGDVVLAGAPFEGDWRERALCAQTDPEAFFPEQGGSTRTAKRICLACEVRPECLDYAMRTREVFGIWGGLSEHERRTLRRRAV